MQEKFSLLTGGSDFNWLYEAHPLGMAVCFSQLLSQFAYLNIELIQKHPYRNTQNNI